MNNKVVVLIVAIAVLFLFVPVVLVAGGLFLFVANDPVPVESYEPTFEGRVVEENIAIPGETIEVPPRSSNSATEPATVPD